MARRVGPSEAGPGGSCEILPGRPGYLVAAGLTLGMGIIGVVALQVRRRSQEAGIRLALGARRVGIYWILSRELVLVVTAGAVVGAGGAALVTRLLQGWLYGIDPLDPAAFLGIPSLLVAVAGLTALLTARRLARCDPRDVLKTE